MQIWEGKGLGDLVVYSKLASRLIVWHQNVYLPFFDVNDEMFISIFACSKLFACWTSSNTEAWGEGYFHRLAGLHYPRTQALSCGRENEPVCTRL